MGKIHWSKKRKEDLECWYSEEDETHFRGISFALIARNRVYKISFATALATLGGNMPLGLDQEASFS